MSLDLGTRALIVSDCEGYEGNLFDLELVRFLTPHDVVIEVHDFNDITLTETLVDLFSQTHNCEVIRSVDDIIKAYDYHFDELTTLDIQQRFAILNEGRPCAMQWILAESRAGTQSRTT